MRKKATKTQKPRARKAVAGAIKDLEAKADPQGGFLACAPGGALSDGTLPTEQVSLNYSKVEISYRPKT